MPRRGDVPVDDPEPGQSPPRRNPRTRLLNKAREEAGLYDGRAEAQSEEATPSTSRFPTKITGRTARLAVNVTDETRQRLRQMAARDQITVGELIERVIEAYENSVRRK